MNPENQTPAPDIRSKYFLISKRGTMIFAVLVLMAYGAAVLWSEFVFSVDTSGSTVESREKAKHLICPSEAVKNLTLQKNILPKRRFWLFDQNKVYGFYDEVLIKYPDCLASEVFLSRGLFLGETFYYYDRATNKPTVKVTIESVK